MTSARIRIALLASLLANLALGAALLFMGWREVSAAVLVGDDVDDPGNPPVLGEAPAAAAPVPEVSPLARERQVDESATAAGPDGGRPAPRRFRGFLDQPEADAISTAFEACSMTEGRVTGRLPEAGGLVDLSAVEGVSAAQLACLTRELDSDGLRPREQEMFLTYRQSGSETEFSVSSTPPLSENVASFPGVDPADVAASCATRDDHECVVRTSARITPLTAADRRRLFMSLLALERWDDLRTEMGRVPPDELDRYGVVQGLLWRLDHGYPAGRVSEVSMLVR